jgi:hypothetical protein
MPAISTCPRCQQQVSIPRHVESDSLVRCPLCHAEYPLSESLDLAPPELIPVVLPAVLVDAEEEAGASASSSATTEKEALGGSEHEEAGEYSLAAHVAEPRSAAPFSDRPPSRRRRPKSALQTLFEVVTGGLAGCLVAYYGLAFYYGPQFRHIGIPNLPLPFIEQITTPPLDSNNYIKVEPSPEEKPAKPKPATPSKARKP